MPLARRKKVLITKDEDGFQREDPDSPVYYVPQTGEIFHDYTFVNVGLSGTYLC